MTELPPLFIQRIREQFTSEADDLLSSYQLPSVTSLRLHPEKSVNHAPNWGETTQVPWATGAFWLNERPSFALDPAFHGGVYYVQESSSMLLQWILKELFTATKPLRVLDACAAPGGKTTILSDFIGKSGVVVANELNRTRAQILREVLTKWGATNTIITSSDAQSFAGGQTKFDLIVLDAPCSGEGLFRKDAGAVGEWSLQAVNGCATRQMEIVREVINALSENGVLIYSTCTLSFEENERVVEALVRDHGMEYIHLSPPQEWGFDTERFGHGIRSLPHRSTGEGFFIAALRNKRGEQTRQGKSKAQKMLRSISREEAKWALDIGFDIEDAFVFNQTIYQIPTAIQELENIASTAFILEPGSACAHVMGKWVEPAHAFAMRPHTMERWTDVALDIDAARDYLRGAALPNVNERGWCTVSYQGARLGWVKGVQGRLNNAYPKEWRLRLR
ncbi:MAG: methyltransferase RsmF C-terminal domain-like protein [Flavobacteriales bacterium]